MNSKSVLLLHTTVLAIFVISTFSSLFLSFIYPDIFTSKLYTYLVIIIPILTIYSWEKMKGCPLTVWENKLRGRERKETYHTTCLEYYSKDWFGVNIKGKTFDRILILFFTFPILAIFFATYF